MVLADHVHGAALREIRRDHLPRAAAVARAHDVRLVVAALEIVDAGVDHIRVVRRRRDVRDEARVGDARDALDLPPRTAAVLSDLDQAVVGAGVEQPFLLGRFTQRGHCAGERGRAVARDGVDAPEPPEHLHRRARDVAREVGADRLPVVATVVGAVDALRCEIEPRAAERTDDDRCVPVPARRVLTRLLLGDDPRAGAGPAIEPHEPAVLRLGVDGVVVLGIDAALEAVAAIGHEPVRVANAVDAAGARGATE